MIRRGRKEKKKKSNGDIVLFFSGFLSLQTKSRENSVLLPSPKGREEGRWCIRSYNWRRLLSPRSPPWRSIPPLTLPDWPDAWHTRTLIFCLHVCLLLRPQSREWQHDVSSVRQNGTCCEKKKKRARKLTLRKKKKMLVGQLFLGRSMEEIICNSSSIIFTQTQAKLLECRSLFVL